MCSIIGSKGAFSNPEMLNLKNPRIEVKIMLTLIVTLMTLMALVIQRGIKGFRSQRGTED